jgi:DNA polymerase III epsilon subunit-like protein
MAYLEPGKAFSRQFGTEKATFYSLVRPLSGCQPDTYCYRVHNLRLDDVRKTPSFESVWAELMDLVKRQQVASHADVGEEDNGTLVAYLRGKRGSTRACQVYAMCILTCGVLLQALRVTSISCGISAVV